MKTAMQELIERIEEEFDAMGYPLVIDLEPFLEKEKQQIRMAVDHTQNKLILNDILVNQIGNGELTYGEMYYNDRYQNK
jgi:hypothetical protein